MQVYADVSVCRYMQMYAGVSVCRCMQMLMLADADVSECMHKTITFIYLERYQ
jgi:hypothetical protein